MHNAPGQHFRNIKRATAAVTRVLPVRWFANVLRNETSVGKVKHSENTLVTRERTSATCALALARDGQSKQPCRIWRPLLQRAGDIPIHNHDHYFSLFYLHLACGDPLRTWADGKNHESDQCKCRRLGVAPSLACPPRFLYARGPHCWLFCARLHTWNRRRVWCSLFLCVCCFVLILRMIEVLPCG